MQTRPETAMPEIPARDMAWRDLSYDVGWEATASGVIRCHSVLNRRSDIAAAVEGLSLQALFCESQGSNALDLLRTRKHVRHVEIRLPRHFGPERLYLTGRLLADGRCAGTLTALHPRHDDAFHGQVALLSQITQARTREEGYRREAETMLAGLRILLGEDTALEKLEALARLITDAINAGPHRLLRILRNGQLQNLGADQPPLRGAQALAALFRGLPQVSILREDSLGIAALRTLLDVHTGDVAIIFLPIASESIALLCAARAPEGFSASNVQFANRFALILHQALALKDEQDKLVQSTKLSALGQMSASLAHELRQPLNTISIAAQNLELMAENGDVTSDALKPKVARILGQVERASQIMDRIRRFSRKGSESFAPTDLAQLAEGVRVLMEHLLLAAHMRLEIDVPAGLSVRCDAIKIEQLLVNLVRNAMDAIAGIGSVARGEAGVIKVRGFKIPHGIMLRVEDNGPGFPPDIAERPLETFFTTKDADAGTGLGLSICHMIAREHAGKLELGNHQGGAYAALHLPERRNG